MVQWIRIDKETGKETKMTRSQVRKKLENNYDNIEQVMNSVIKSNGKWQINTSFASYTIKP